MEMRGLGRRVSQGPRTHQLATERLRLGRIPSGVGGDHRPAISQHEMPVTAYVEHSESLPRRYLRLRRAPRLGDRFNPVVEPLFKTLW